MSGINTSNIWAWVHADEARLAGEGGQHATIVEQWNRFNRLHHQDFAAADHAISLALDAARATDELRWQLLLRHWRVQLWLDADIQRALPEAVDLLDLATDERLRDVPQRICAYHDVVDCYVRMDPVGYRDEIEANSQEILAQLPKRHPCADCARLHQARAAGAAGREAEAQERLAHFAADLHDGWAGNLIGQADVYEMLERWDDAEATYRRAMTLAQSRRQGAPYLEALLGAARALVGKGDFAGAASLLSDARHTAKYTGGVYLLARQLEVEGLLSAAVENAPAAIAYLTQSARQYLALSRYRQAALVALHAAGLAHAAEHADATEILDLAARAIGAMPTASADVRARLAAFGRTPIEQAPAQEATVRAASEEPPASALTERRSLDEALALYITQDNARAAATTLYRLARWHIKRDEPRAALDYFIMNAALERLLRLSMNDREDAIGALTQLREQLPTGTIDAALSGAESGAPALIAPLVAGVSSARWRWVIRTIAAESQGRAAVEPEPEEEEDHGFQAWLDHVASMTALVLRFRERISPDRLERWARSLDHAADQIEPQIGPAGEGREVVLFARGMAALARGATPETVLASVRPPFNEVIERTIEIAQTPVWRHPGNAPLDFFVEQDAQRAVRALRLHDESREDRLANMALRFELQAYDLNSEEDLAAVARFVTELARLVAAGGAVAPAPEPPLEEPFASILSAVFAAGQSTAGNA